MKLKLYQQGGGLIYTPFIPGMQDATSTGGSRTNTSDGESKIDALDKELIALMKGEDLLPSDIDYITKQVVRFQKQASKLSVLGDYSSAMPGMLQILGAVKKAKFFKDQNDTIATKMAQENAGAEFAIDGNGLIYAWNKETNQLNKIKPSEFDVDKYSPLSNSELLYYRQTALPNDSQIFNDLSDLVGIGSVIKEIDRIIKEFGTEENAGYISKDKAVQHVLIEANSPDGLYKLTTKKPSGDVSKAWASVYRQLAPNMQHLLNARATISGLSIPEYIHDIVIRNTSTEKKIDYDVNTSKAAGYDTDPNKVDGTKLQAEDNYQIRFALGEGMPVSFALTPTAAKINEQGTYKVEALDFGPMLNMEQLPIDQMNLQTLLFSGTEKSSALATSVRSTDVTFGNKLLDYSELPAVLVNGGESLTTKVYLPYRNENGHYVPDFEKIKNFNEYMKEAKGNLSVTERNALLQKHHLLASDIVPSEDGKSFVLRDTMPFLAFSGYAGDDTLKLTDDNKQFLSKVDKAKGKTLRDGYNNALKYNDVYAKKNSVIANGGFTEAGKRDFWEGIVFIPCPDSFYAYNSTKNQPVTKESLTNISSKVIANNILNEAERQARQDPNYDTYRQLGQWTKK